MPTDQHNHLPERAKLRLRVALAGLQLARLPEPCYKVFYRINILNGESGSVRLMGRKWHLRDITGNTQIIEATQIFNDAPVLTPGAVFSFSGYQVFRKPPLLAELRLFGQDHTGRPFITPPLQIPLSEQQEPEPWQ